MDPETFERLELGALLALLARNVQTPLGRRRALALAPSTDPGEIRRALDLTTECRNYLASGGGFGLSGIEDPSEALARLQIEGASLDTRQILVIERLVSLAVDLRAELTRPEHREPYPELSEIGARIPDMRRLAALTQGKFLPSGEIADDATPELRRIRREMTACRARIHRSLEAMMRAQPKAVQEEIVTFRNGRFVIPIRTDARNQVPGVMHGLSASGQTSYMEPLSIIEQNNELVRLRESEEMEIARLLLEITEAFRAHLPGVSLAAEGIEEIDFAQAKARLAEEFRCTRPQVSSERKFLLRDARHPLLEHMMRQSGSEVVPISFEMDEQHPVMVISGPNAGGKTVVLKTTGLMALMAQMGLHVPAREAKLPLLNQVFADIGDQQSIAANLSTFTAHLRNISEMSQRISPPALVLIDEVGTGTDPDEGAALAVAIVDYFRGAGALAIATTHYNKLKMWASQADGVLNASVEFDERTLRPTYRLLAGIAGVSAGLEIARRMSLPREIVEQARMLIDPAHSEAGEYLRRLKVLIDEQEALRAALEEERRVTADKYARIEEDSARREALRLAEFEKEQALVIRKLTDEGRKLLDSLNDRVLAAQVKKQIEKGVARLRQQAVQGSRELAFPPGTGGRGGETPKTAGSPETASAEEIREGDRVLIRPLNQQGTVDSVKGETFTVSVGSLKFRAGIEELQFLTRASESSRGVPSSRAGDDLNLAEKEFSTELKVIGLPADEAVDRVDKFLDEAYYADAESVRIIHGHGKGILRRAISKFLSDHRLVERFESAPPNQGGAGATIVSLRKD